MKPLIRFAAAAGLSAVFAVSVQATIERIVEKSFTVQPGGTLKVDSQGGDVRVESSSDLVVKVIAKERIKAGSDAEADKLLKKLTLTLEQQGNDVTARAEYEKQSIGVHWGSWPPVEVNFVVTVPARYSADLRTSGGEIAVGDLDGQVRAHTSGGNVKLGKVTGEVDADSSGGNMVLAQGGSAVHLRTSGGDIRVGRAVGPADLHSSGGDIEVKSVENALTARTSGGNVNAAITGPIKGDCILETSGGRVKVVVGAGASFRLDASTSGGEVDAEGFTIAIDRGALRKSSLAGNVNGGGPLLRLRSSGGDIVIRAGASDQAVR